MKASFENSGVNQNILNLITPSGISYSKTGVVLGDNYGKCIVITRYAQNPEYGWLSLFTAVEGTTASIEFKPTDSGNLISRCNEQIKAYRNDLTSVKEESVRITKEKAIDDITKMIKRVNNDGEVVGYTNIVLLIQAATEDKLNDRVKKIESIITSYGGGTKTLTLKQREGLKCVAPYGLPNPYISDMAERNMPLSTFIGGFANAASGINDGVGFLLGKTDKGKPIILNMWERGRDRTNSNWLITGVQGMGKSGTLKFILELEYALGTKIIILDPEREFVDLTINLDGKVINAGGGKGGRINPLQPKPAPKLDETDDELDNLYKDEGNGVGDLALHFQTFRTFMRIYKKSISDIEMSKLEEILEKTYLRFGITWDTDIVRLLPKEFPIFSDLYEDIEEELKSDPESSILKNLKAYIRSLAIGADSCIFNGHTSLENNASIIDLDISNLLDGDPNILKAQLHNINSWAWQQIATNRNERILYVIDEGYLIVDPEVPEGIIFVKNTAKRIRKYEGGLMFITHSVVDILDPAVRRHGQAIIDGACFKFIMGTDGKNLRDTKELFNLTEQEESLLLSKQRGKGLLFAGSTRINAKIEIPEKFLQLMGKAGGR